MTRIYLDSNVYSKLRTNQTEAYRQLNLLLTQHKNNLSFYFSIAHIRDKKNDKSEYKFADFDFIESFTRDNYVAYNPVERQTTFYLATPRDVFTDDQDEAFTADSLLGVFDPAENDEPLIRAAKSLMNKWMDLSIFPGLDLSDIPEDRQALLAKLLPVGQPRASMREWMVSQFALHEEMLRNHETYKALRKLVDEGVNNGRFVLNGGEIDFNLAFKDSVFNKNFFELVRDSLNKKAEEKIPVYDFYLQAYQSLDLLGISKDKITKKNTYSNLLNDAMHSYYAQFADYYVTEDKKSLDKSRALYEQLEIAAKVLTVEEFIADLPSFGMATEPNLASFLAKLAEDIENCSTTPKSPTDFGYQCYFKINRRYLNFFDVLMEVKENDSFHYLLRQVPKHFLSTPNYREIGVIVDRGILLFGPDVHEKGQFQFEIESEEMRANRWEGRYWRIDSLLVSLVNHHALNELCLIVRSFPAKTA